MFSFIDIFPFIMLSIHFVDKWLLSKGLLWKVYLLAIVGGICNITFNILLVNTLNGQHKSILLFSVSSFWTMMMALKGMKRLSKEGNNK